MCVSSSLYDINTEAPIFKCYRFSVKIIAILFLCGHDTFT